MNMDAPSTRHSKRLHFAAEAAREALLAAREANHNTQPAELIAIGFAAYLSALPPLTTKRDCQLYIAAIANAVALRLVGAGAAGKHIYMAQTALSVLNSRKRKATK